MKIYVALELTRTEGKNLSADEVAGFLEEDMIESLEVDDSLYDVSVAGIGTTVKELQESVKNRKS